MQVPGAGEDQFLSGRRRTAAASPAEEGRQPGELLLGVLAGDDPRPLGSLGGMQLPAPGSHVGGGRRLPSDYCYLSYKPFFQSF